MRLGNNLMTIGLISLVRLFCSCNETIVPTDKIFEQNSDWLIFAPDYFDFKGISYNIDNNYLKVKYKTKLINQVHYFRHVDSLANLNMWRIDAESDFKKIYRKKSEAYPAANFNDMISITYDIVTKEIKFDYKPEYK